MAGLLLPRTIMAELVAGALLTGTFDKLLERLASPEFRRNSTGFKLKRLESKLKTAGLYLDDAENRQLSNKGIKEWLDNLKHLVFQADDLSEEICDSQNRQSLAGTVRGDLNKVLMGLEVLLDGVDALGLKDYDSRSTHEGSSSTANPAPLLAKHRVFGRNDDRDVILELLLSEKAFGRQQIGVVPIVGMGGIGKTTLAHLVYNDTRVKPEFQLRAWVTVSTEFNICKILKSILEKISPGAVGTGDLYQLQEKMEEALSGKKFLIVLDDVWVESYGNWNLLKSNFEWGVLGSRVVVTTRSVEVGKMVTTGPIHLLSKVSSEDCWSIFVDHAFSGRDSYSYPELHEIGRRIVEKCYGLPLAVMAMGGLLCSTRDLREWENVLNSPVWDIGENNQGQGVLPSLWLSYRYLPLSVKQCFAYCSVFPQDYEIDKEQMVLLWMAEGFLPCGKTEKRSMEELGEKYFDILVSRLLFQRSSINESKFVMHDLIHDLAALVSGEFCINVAQEAVELEHVTIRTCHLSYDDVSLDSKLLSGVSKAKHLRSFLRPHEYGEFCSYKFVKKLITNHRRLRALSICTRDPISASICNLKHLRYLNLSRCEFEEVTSSVCTLFNLETLILSYCRALTQLPTDITNLIKLRHLDITDTGLTHMPQNMGNLKELRTLILSYCRELTQLPTDITKLIKLRHLDITETWLTHMPSQMGNLKELRTLILSYCRELTRLPTDITKLIKLRHLYITETALIHMPPHMGNLKELRTLSCFIVGDSDISACSNIKEMQELQHLSGALTISGLENSAKFQDAGKDILRHKANLKELVLKWDNRITNEVSIREEKDVLDALEPHTKLERLVIRGYQASSFPIWVGDISFDKLVSVELEGRFCKSLPPLWQLPSLLNLVISGFEKLEKIGVEFYGNDSSTSRFQCLETLELNGMRSLNEWGFVDKSFPCLKKLKLSDCPKLPVSSIDCNTVEELEIREHSCLESFPLDKFPMVRKLSLEKCGNLKSVTNGGNSESLTEMRLKSCPEMESLGLPKSLTLLAIDKCDKFISPQTHFGLQNLPALESLLISKCELAATSTSSELFAQELLPNSLASLVLFYLGGFKSINGSSFQQATSLKTLKIYRCDELESLPEKELPSSLSRLEIFGCRVLERKYNKSKGESYQRISHIPDLTIGGKTTDEIGEDEEW